MGNKLTGDPPDVNVTSGESYAKDGAAVATAIVAVGVLPPGTSGAVTVATAAAAILPRVVDRVTDMFKNRGRRRLNEWVQRLLEGGASAPLEQLASGAASEDEEDTVLRSVRALNDAVSDAAIAPLAALARQYLSAGRATDWFFRAASRFLMDAEGGEIGETAEIFRAWAKYAAREEVQSYEIAVERFHDVVNVYFDWSGREWRDEDGNEVEPGWDGNAVEAPSINNILRLMQIHGLIEGSKIHIRTAAKLTAVLAPDSGVEFFDEESEMYAKPVGDPWP